MAFRRPANLRGAGLRRSGIFARIARLHSAALGVIDLVRWSRRIRERDVYCAVESAQGFYQRGDDAR